MLKIIVALFALLIPVSSYAVTVSISSSVDVSNPPGSSVWRVECGNSTGVYNVISKDFAMVVPGQNRIKIVDIFPSTSSWFCRTSFVTPFGQGPFSSELPVTITPPSIPSPSLTVVP